MGETTALTYAGGAWASGPGPIYDRIADALVDQLPDDLSGRLVLDVGAGTGAGSRAAARRGARVVAADLSLDMLLHERGSRPPAIQADALRLPFRPRTFDTAIAAFVLSHVPAPHDALREMRCVVRDGGVILAAQYGRGSGHLAKEAVERVAESYGFRRPDWYDTVKRTGEAALDTPGLASDLALQAGFEDVQAVVRPVATDVRTAADLVAWRLGTPAFAEFASSLDEQQRAAFVRDAERAVGENPEPYAPLVLMLVARVPR